MQQQTQLETDDIGTQSLPDTAFSEPQPLQANFRTSNDIVQQHTSETRQSSTLAKISQYRKAAKTRYAANLIFGLVLMFIFPLSQAFTSPGHSIIVLPLLISLCFSVSLFMYLLTWFQMLAVKQTIAAIDDISMIGPLAEAWDAERFLKPKATIIALRRLLPRLQASDSNLLTREQRTCLYNAISWKPGRAVYQYDRQLTIAILHALQQIGDKEALPYVRRAAMSPHKDVHTAANDCLGFLIEQAEEHKRGAQLLRPADARTSAPDVLLRASTGMTLQQHTPPEQLLRAHEPE